MSIVPMLIDHCSPTLASLKCGSLFSIRPEDMAYTMREARALSDELAPKGLAIRVIDVGDGRALCYLYRPCQLCRMLACEKEAAFLTEQGYPYLTVEDAVDLLCARLSQGGAFPHEIGLFLGYPIDDPFGKGVRFLNRSTPRTIFLTKDEYDEFLQKALADRNDLAMRVTRELFIFSCETGLRFSDVLDLKWTHLKKDSKGVTYISKIQCKTKELVEIPLMSKWPKVLLAKYRNVSTGENVFPRLSNGCINRKLKMLAEKAGIGKCLSFHVARHTFASHLANAGVPLYIVAKLLGDKSLDMVHRVYTNTERTELTEAMKKLSA